MKPVFRSCVLFVCLLVSSVASAASFCPTNMPVIDGIFDCREWDSAQTVDFQVNVPEGGTAPARLYFMNDDKFLYVGLRILREKNWSSSFAVILDANYDRWLTAGDDLMVLSHSVYSGNRVTDGVYYTGGTCPIGAICSGSDVDFGGRNDVSGAVGEDGKYVMYELSKPLATMDGWDATMPIGSLIAMTFDLRVFGADGKFADTEYPALPSSGQWVDYVIKDCSYWR